MAKLRLFLAILAASSLEGANVLTCTPSAVTPSLHAEGLAERLGDIVLSRDRAGGRSIEPETPGRGGEVGDWKETERGKL